MRNIVVCALFLGLGLQACRKEVAPGTITQPVVFEYEFINSAWIFTHFGWMIDENGGVHQYTRHDEWKVENAEGFITKGDLQFNLNLTDTTLFQVDKDQLLAFFDERFEVLNTELDTADQHMADSGQGALYIYVWDSQKASYKKQLLASKGDLELSPKNTTAQGMVSWLVEQGKKTDRFYWWQ